MRASLHLPANILPEDSHVQQPIESIDPSNIAGVVVEDAGRETPYPGEGGECDEILLLHWHLPRLKLFRSPEVGDCCQLLSEHPADKFGEFAFAYRCLSDLVRDLN